MIVLKCAKCGAIWVGLDECDAESKADQYPCACHEEIAKMSDEELLAEIKKL